MIYSPKAIRWVDCLEFLAILGFALLLPASLPAGGADRLPLELRRRQSGRDPLVVPFAALLRSAPRHEAPPLQRLTSGQPMRVLRSWQSPSGRRWFQVSVASAGLGNVQRGWLKVS
jgi:hypothetical protein